MKSYGVNHNPHPPLHLVICVMGYFFTRPLKDITYHDFMRSVPGLFAQVVESHAEWARYITFKVIYDEPLSVLPQCWLLGSVNDEGNVFYNHIDGGMWTPNPLKASRWNDLGDLAMAMGQIPDEVTVNVIQINGTSSSASAVGVREAIDAIPGMTIGEWLGYAES